MVAKAISILEVFPSIEKHKLSIEPVFSDLDRKHFAFWVVKSYDGTIKKAHRDLVTAVIRCVEKIEEGNHG